jgi:hypothetical protein
MSETAKRRFSWRAFWSLLLLLTAAGLAWTGLENHELGFDGLTAARHAWMSAHNALALLFVVAVAAHVLLNGKALLRHARGTPRWPSREVVVALTVTAGLLFLTVGHAQLAR